MWTVYSIINQEINLMIDYIDVYEPKCGHGKWAGPMADSAWLVGSVRSSRPRARLSWPCPVWFLDSPHRPPWSPTLKQNDMLGSLGASSTYLRAWFELASLKNGLGSIRVLCSGRVSLTRARAGSILKLGLAAMATSVQLLADTKKCYGSF